MVGWDAVRAPVPAAGSTGWAGAGVFGPGKGLEAAVWGWGGQSSASCAFLSPEIPFQMDNSIVRGEKSPLVGIRKGAFGD